MIGTSWQRCAALAGSLAVLVYLVSHFLPLPPLPEHLVFFGIGPSLVVFMVALGRTMAERRKAVSLELAPVLGAIGGAVFTLMAVVQSAIHPLIRQPPVPPLDAETARALRLAWKGLDSVQLGMDVVFDIFYLLAVALFGWNMRHDRRFGAALGAVGALLSLPCLALNVWSFPTPPRPDLGPFIALWGLAVVVQLWRGSLRPAEPAEAAGTGTAPAAGR